MLNSLSAFFFSSRSFIPSIALRSSFIRVFVCSIVALSSLTDLRLGSSDTALAFRGGSSLTPLTFFFGASKGIFSSRLAYVSGLFFAYDVSRMRSLLSLAFFTEKSSLFLIKSDTSSFILLGSRFTEFSSFFKGLMIPLPSFSRLKTEISASFFSPFLAIFSPTLSIVSASCFSPFLALFLPIFSRTLSTSLAEICSSASLPSRSSSLNFFPARSPLTTSPPRVTAPPNPQFKAALVAKFFLNSFALSESAYA